MVETPKKHPFWIIRFPSVPLIYTNVVRRIAEMQPFFAVAQPPY